MDCIVNDIIIDQNTYELSVGLLDGFWEKMNDSFKDSELRSQFSQYKAFSHRKYRVSYFEQKNNNAFALWWDFEDIIFVEYILVSPGLKRNGLGSKLLEHLVKKSKEVVLEVEQDSTLDDFYKKNGFVCNSYAYSAISLQGSEPNKYHIYSFKKMLSKEQYDKFIELINKPQYQF